MDRFLERDELKKIAPKKTPPVAIRPQPGPQTQFLSSPADIAVYGGAAGGGKTWAIVAEPLRHMENPKFSAVIFRRTYPMIENEGGLWDESGNLYPQLGAKPRKTRMMWVFPSEMSVRFAHMQHETDKNDWQGAQIPFIGFDELTHFCLHPDTEVLTDTGWKAIPTVTTDDRVASLTPERDTVYAPVSRMWEFPYDGDLLTLDQRNGIHYKVTPNHRMVVNTQKQDGSWKFQRAEDIKFAKIPRTGTWEGQPLEDIHFTSPCGRGHGANSNNAETVDINLFLQFLGWYLSEGCAFEDKKGSSPKVSIRQVYEPKRSIIRELLTKLPWNFGETKDGQFIICSRQLYEYVKPLGDTYTKRIPRWVFQASPEQLQLFWDAFIAGDGHRTPKGAIHFGLANEGLIDDLQEMAFLLGLIATKGYTKTSTGFDVWRLTVSQPTRHETFVRGREQKREHYKGSVWCLTTEPHHSFLVRSNGRYFWTGNTESQFFYLLSRNRSLCGVKPYVRATCNPDATSWVKRFLAPWVDQFSEIKAKGGELLWMVRNNNEIKWYRTQEEALADNAHLLELGVDPIHLIKSVTFIFASIKDNQELIRKDPGYLGNLLSLPLVERMRLLEGNWDVLPEAGKVFNREWFRYADEAPEATAESGAWDVRFWDFAASEKKTKGDDPDWTVGTRIRKHKGHFYIMDVQRFRATPGDLEARVLKVAESDGALVPIRWEEESGSSGKIASRHLITEFAGYDCRGIRPQGDKVARAMPFASQAEAQNVTIIRGSWNEQWLTELHHFPDGNHDDCVDSASGAFSYISRFGADVTHGPDIWST